MDHLLGVKDEEPCRDDAGRFAPCGAGGAGDSVGGTIGEYLALHRQALDAVAELKEKLGESIKSYVDKVPGGQYLREKLAALQAGAQERYGARTMAGIAAAANVVSWGAFTAGLATGHTVYIPVSGLLAVGAVMAEGYLQASRGLRALGLSKAASPTSEVELTDAEVRAAGAELARQLEEEYAGYLLSHPETIS